MGFRDRVLTFAGAALRSGGGDTKSETAPASMRDKKCNTHAHGGLSLDEGGRAKEGDLKLLNG